MKMTLGLVNQFRNDIATNPEKYGLTHAWEWEEEYMQFPFLQQSPPVHVDDSVMEDYLTYNGEDEEVYYSGWIYPLGTKAALDKQEGSASVAVEVYLKKFFYAPGVYPETVAVVRDSGGHVVKIFSHPELAEAFIKADGDSSWDYHVYRVETEV